MNQPKNHPNAAAGSVGIDYFLYTCFEHDSNSRSRNGNADFRWPIGLSCSKQMPSNEVERLELPELLRLACKWYIEKVPSLSGDSPINLENLADIVPGFLLLTKDIDAVVKAKTGDYLPNYDGDESDEIWSSVNQAFIKYFPNHSKLFLRFLHWSHASQPQVLDIEPGSRPPVGRYMPRKSTRSPAPERSASRGGSSDFGGRSQPRASTRSPGAEDARQKSRGSDSKRDQGRTKGSSDKKRDEALEKSSLKEVLLAVQKLNTDQSLAEYRLSPTNSYYRRLQHKQVEDEGLKSFSDGEGASRSVVVVRELPKGKSKDL